jgi:hypothetical protein
VAASTIETAVIHVRHPSTCFFVNKMNNETLIGHRYCLLPTITIESITIHQIRNKKIDKDEVCYSYPFLSLGLGHSLQRQLWCESP